MDTIPSVKLTAKAPENRPKRPKRKVVFQHHFSGAKMLVFGRVHKIQYLHCGMGTLHFTVFRHLPIRNPKLLKIPGF